MCKFVVSSERNHVYHEHVQVNCIFDYVLIITSVTAMFVVRVGRRTAREGVRRKETNDVCFERTSSVSNLREHDRFTSCAMAQAKHWH